MYRVHSRKSRKPSGFTIVELLVVIVVIGILAAITIVAYTGITSKATVASLTSDLDNASKQLKMYNVDHGAYPATLDGSNCPTGPADTKYCLKPSPGNAFTYSSASPYSIFTLYATNTTTYQITDNTLRSGPWIAGIAATAMAGKYVFGTDIGTTTQYETTNTAVASPQGATGLDPIYLAKYSLVADNSVSFTGFPARQACKDIGGRLPNMQELLAIYTGRVTYGNNFQATNYWSSTEIDSSSAYIMQVANGYTYPYAKTSPNGVRCVAG